MGVMVKRPTEVRKINAANREEVFLAVAYALFSLDMLTTSMSKKASRAKNMTADYFCEHLPQWFEHHYHAYDYSWFSSITKQFNDELKRSEKLIRGFDLPAITPYYDNCMDIRESQAQKDRRVPDNQACSPQSGLSNDNQILGEDEHAKGSKEPGSFRSSNPVTVMQADQVHRLHDLETLTIKNFITCCRMMRLQNPSFDYRAYVEPRFLSKRNQLTTTCRNTYHMDPDLLADWGTPHCDVVYFMEELLRLRANSGRDSSESLFVEKMQSVLYPILRGYHPSQSDIWLKVFGAIDDIRMQYGESVYTNTVEPTLDLHQSVAYFWKELVAPPNTSIALKRLVSLVQEQINHNFQQKHMPRPGFYDTMAMMADKASQVKAITDEAMLFNFGYLGGGNESKDSKHSDREPNKNPKSPKLGWNKEKSDESGGIYLEGSKQGDKTLGSKQPPGNITCHACGRRGHGYKECHNKNPDKNTDMSTPFHLSEIGKAWKALGQDVVPPNKYDTLEHVKNVGGVIRIKKGNKGETSTATLDKGKG